MPMPRSRRLTAFPTSRTNDGNSTGMTSSAPGSARARDIHDTSRPRPPLETSTVVGGALAVGEAMAVERDGATFDGEHAKTVAAVAGRRIPQGAIRVAAGTCFLSRIR